MRRRPRGARRSSARRADRPHCGRRANPQATRADAASDPSRIGSDQVRGVRFGANTSPPSTRARARARDGSGNQRPWPADKVERWPIERLIPYAKNARTHSDAQIAAIAVAPYLMGYLKDATGGFTAGLLAVAFFPFLSAILVLILGHNPALERSVAPAE
jgi:hypothetical protein